MLLSDNTGQLLKPEYGEPEFRAEAKERLPELADEINSHAGLLHPLMGVLAAAAREAIVVSDFPFLRRLFEFVAEAAQREDADPEIENAVVLSFLEPEDFEGPKGEEARELLPSRLATLIREAA